MSRRAFSGLGVCRADGGGAPFEDPGIALGVRSSPGVRGLAAPEPAGAGPAMLRLTLASPPTPSVAAALTAAGLDLYPSGAAVRVEGDVRLVEDLPGLEDTAATLLAAHRLAHRPRSRFRIMGILNATPDSFSDGGRHLDPSRALDHALGLLAGGAEILDVGGESTRPGSRAVDAGTELGRVMPILERLLAETDAILSIDTQKAAVAREALAAGVHVVNDVSAGRADPDLLPTVAEFGAEVILMHMLGSPRTMQDAPAYRDVVGDVAEFLRGRVRVALDRGVELESIAIDPGIGFGKRLGDNLALLRGLGELRSLGRPLLVGLSRKSFLGELSGEKEAQRRNAETAAATTLAACFGADIHRVHDADMARRALSIAMCATGAPATARPSAEEARL